nr:AraC family transcriptional regulator [Paraburkholderia sp. J8-2]
MVETRQVSNFGVISLRISQQPGLRDALATFIRYRHLFNDSVVMLLEDAGNAVIIRQEVTLGVPSRQATELAMGVVFRMCSALLGVNWQPLSVNFTHNAPTDLQIHRRLFGCPLEFNSEFKGIVCLAADLDKPNPNSVSREVRGAIYLMLPMGRTTCEAVAQRLGMSHAA